MSRINLWVFSLAGFFLPALAYSLGDEPEYEEIYISVRVQGIGTFELNALYSYTNNQLQLPVTGLFQLLSLKHEVSPNLDSIFGFLIDEAKKYLIDHNRQIIQVGETIIQLNPGDLIKTESGLFLNSAIFGNAFGLFCTFHFRSLSVELKTELDLPAIRELRLAQMRKNVERLKGQVVVDSTIGRNYHLLKFGMIEWGINATQINGKDADTRLATGFGAELLGGEANIFLNYSTRDGFLGQNQQYFWRWANNNSKLVRQVRAGRVIPGSISSLFDPVVGASITNTPTSFRRSFGEYTLTDFTEPGWTVELYVNNVIVDYVTADASGFFSFNIPLVYGTSQIVMKFYGPYGEERIREQYLNIPYNFLPKGEFEYTLTGGMVQDGRHSLFSRASFHYGVNRFFTAGGGMEYLSSIPSRGEIPFLSASVAPFNNLLLSGEYAHRVRTRVLMSYRLPSSLMLELDYANYTEGQQALHFNYLEERKATLAIPFRLLNFRGFTRISYKQNVYSLLNYNTCEVLFSMHYKRISANISGFANWVDQRRPYIYSNLALGIRLGRGFLLRPQAQLDISNAEIISYKAAIEKRLNRQGYISVSYEENNRVNYRSVDLTLRWDLPFAQTNLDSHISSESITTTQGARGSFAFGSGNNYVHASNRSSIGRGGLTIIPFLDVNHNGIRDEGEALATGLGVRINGGRIIRSIGDTLIRINELEPYASYLIELDDTRLENIAWRIRQKAISVYIDPNQFKKLEIPVLPMGEANGMVIIEDERGRRGLGRMLVNFYTSKGQFVEKTMTEPDGYFTFLGLAPGRYYAMVDPVQAERLSITSQPESKEFTIDTLSFGDIVDGLNFSLVRTQPSVLSDAGDEPDPHRPDDATAIENNDKENFKDTRREENQITQPAVTRMFYVQAGAFRSKSEADLQVKNLKLRFEYPVHLLTEGGFNKVRLGPFHSHAEAKECIKIISTMVTDAFTVRSDQPTVTRMFFVQAGAFISKSEADLQIKNLQLRVEYPVHLLIEGGYNKVRLGPFHSLAEAKKCIKIIRTMITDAFIVVSHTE